MFQHIICRICGTTLGTVHGVQAGKIHADHLRIAHRAEFDELQEAHRQQQAAEWKVVVLRNKYGMDAVRARPRKEVIKGGVNHFALPDKPLVCACGFKASSGGSMMLHVANHIEKVQHAASK